MAKPGIDAFDAKRRCCGSYLIGLRLMDKDLVPQDKNNNHEKNFRSIIYAIDKDGIYNAVPSIGWEPENLAQKQAWDFINETIENTKNQVIEGNLSPIAYFMQKNQFSIKRLSYLTGLSKRKIRKHIRPKTFSSIDQKTLKIYSAIFKVSIETITDSFKIITNL
jgi:hypothetical protein